MPTVGTWMLPSLGAYDSCGEPWPQVIVSRLCSALALGVIGKTEHLEAARRPRLLLADGSRLHYRWQHLNFRIPTAGNPRETWVSTEAPDFFAAVRRRGGSKNRVTGCSDLIFSNSLSRGSE